MRAFVSLEVPGAVLDSLGSFQAELSASGADIKLVERNNLHFTLKFLGEITEAQASEADSRLKELVLPGSKVEIKGVDAFPSSSRPRVVWTGVSRESEGFILPTARRVVASLEGIGAGDERPFQLHLTLGRVRSGRNMGELQEVIRRNHDRGFGIADFRSFRLKSSMLTPRGPVYSDLGEYHLS